MTADQGGHVALVAVKYVPLADPPLRLVDDQLVRSDGAHGLDAVNAVALEWALQQREAGQIRKVVATTMGPPSAVEVLRRALATGADEALIITDPLLAGSDLCTAAGVLAAAATFTAADLVLCGYESSDGSAGALPAALAARLDWPLISRAGSAKLDEHTQSARLEATADVGRGPERFSAGLPAVVSFVEGAIVPRFPKVREMLRVRRIEVPSQSVEQLDVGHRLADGTEVGARLAAVPATPRISKVVGIEEGVDELVAILDVRPELLPVAIAK